jgi:hypothetical protein
VFLPDVRDLTLKLAREVNRLTRWQRPVFARRYDMAVVTEEEGPRSSASGVLPRAKVNLYMGDRDIPENEVRAIRLPVTQAAAAIGETRRKRRSCPAVRTQAHPGVSW